MEENTVEVVGTQYTNAYQILRNVVIDNGEGWDNNGYNYHSVKLSLVPEPENKHDPNAIAVYSDYPTPNSARVKRSGKIGYLPRNSGMVIKERTVVDATIKEGFKRMYIKVDGAGKEINNSFQMKKGDKFPPTQSPDVNYKMK